MRFHFKTLELSKQSARAFLCSFLAVLCAVYAMEAHKRYKIYRQGVTISYENSTWDMPRSFERAKRVGGPFLPNTDITQRDYAADGSLKRTHTFHVNNLGWVSA